ncbi:alpha/beta hydrolase [Nocardioides sp. CPCC 205120]|uniref:alpha/beta hydrolase n=1 Tax=Nocardioides sp. CPCC 205120 TaxID=3406462 RepID=UPI003B50BFD8
MSALTQPVPPYGPVAPGHVPGAAQPVVPADGLRTAGGTGSLAATYASVEQLGGLLQDAGELVLFWGAAATATLVDGDLLQSAPYSPVSFARVESLLVGLTTGRRGLAAQAATWMALGVAVREAVRLVRAADEAVAVTMNATDYLCAYVNGWALTRGARLVGYDGPIPGGPGDDLRWLRDDLEGGGAGADDPRAAVLARLAERLAQDNPTVVEGLLGRSGGFVEGAWDADDSWLPTPFGGDTFVPHVGEAAAVLSDAYVDGVPVVEQVGAPRTGAAAVGTGGLVAALARTATLSGRPSAGGTIEIQRVGTGEGAHHVVLLPGTDDLGTLPWTQDADARDLGTNLRSMAGESTVYQRGIEEAMRAAGIGPDDPVTLVGHSQGGMAAAQVAASGHFRVEDVVTLGSPVALMPETPDGTRVTSLENTRDLVPLLDGRPNPGAVHHLTVTFEGGGDDVVEAHSLDAYARGAAAMDRSDDPAVRQRLEGLRASGAIDGDGPVDVTTYRITRGAPPDLPFGPDPAWLEEPGQAG